MVIVTMMKKKKKKMMMMMMTRALTIFGDFEQRCGSVREGSDVSETRRGHGRDVQEARRGD
jgi:hypothetical protein